MMAGLTETPVKYESFLLKAASAAFARTFEGLGDTNVARIVQESFDDEEVDDVTGVKFFQRANELQLAQLAEGSVTEGASGFSTDAPLNQCALTVTHVQSSAESLPLVNNSAFISLHYTDPATEVIPAGAVPG